MNEADVRIDSIAAGGDGLGRVEGLVVFVPRAAPGDLARVGFVARGRFARGEIRQLIEPSPARVDPPCAHYTADRCGGCQLQHLPYDVQLASKARIVSDALERLGGRRREVPRTQASPRQWRYRRKLTLALRSGGRGEWRAGLHPYDSPGRIFPLRDCPITDERVLDIWRAILKHGSLLPRARALRGAVRIGPNGAAWSSFVLEGGRAWASSERFFEAVPALSELWWIPEPPGAGRSVRGSASRRLLHRRDQGGAPGAVFGQVNSELAALLREYVLEEARRHPAACVVDGYAGVGETAIPLARTGAKVTAIELDPDASRWCGERLPPGSRAITARVEDVLDDVLPADLVLLNPPRGGVHERVTRVLEERRPSAVIYVSCNPATLARDLSRLPGYSLRSVRAFDMFPQTAHVETVCVLETGVAA